MLYFSHAHTSQSRISSREVVARDLIHSLRDSFDHKMEAMASSEQDPQLPFGSFRYSYDR
jgi:hypothetical protein